MNDVRRVNIDESPGYEYNESRFDDAYDGTHALVHWGEWEQALSLRAELDELDGDYQAALIQIRYLEKDLDEAASDEEDWRVHDLESDIRELQDELESVTSGARCATDLWLESWDREQAEQEWRPVSELPTWEYDGRLNATYEVLENY